MDISSFTQYIRSPLYIDIIYVIIQTVCDGEVRTSYYLLADVSNTMYRPTVNVPQPTGQGTLNVQPPQVVIPVQYTMPQVQPTITRPIVPMPTMTQQLTVTTPIPVVPMPTVTRPIVPMPTVTTVPFVPQVPAPKPIVQMPQPQPTVRMPQPTVVVPTVQMPRITTTTTTPVVPTVPKIPFTGPTVPIVPTVPRMPTIPMPIILQPTVPRIVSPKRQLSPIKEFKREITIPVLSPKRETREETKIPDLDSPVETFVEIVIGEQDADIMEEKEYLGYVKYLLNDQSKYDVFTRLFPNNTCPNITFRMETQQSPAPTIRPNKDALIRCIRNKETQGGSVAIYFSYQNHANMLWFDTTNKIINRYDPQVAGDQAGQSTMDDTIRAYLDEIFPDYVYLGNTLETWQYVQGVRGEGRTYKSDYYCQDYSLLYAINRIKGMSHEEAAFALVARGTDVLVDLADLLRALTYKIRAELGKPIPEKYRNWNPIQQ